MYERFRLHFRVLCGNSRHTRVRVQRPKVVYILQTFYVGVYVMYVEMSAGGRIIAEHRKFPNNTYRV